MRVERWRSEMDWGACCFWVYRWELFFGRGFASSVWGLLMGGFDHRYLVTGGIFGLNP